jgi:hypothetical protein
VKPTILKQPVGRHAVFLERLHHPMKEELIIESDAPPSIEPCRSLTLIVRKILVVISLVTSYKYWHDSKIRVARARTAARQASRAIPSPTLKPHFPEIGVSVWLFGIVSFRTGFCH